MNRFIASFVLFLAASSGNAQDLTLVIVTSKDCEPCKRLHTTLDDSSVRDSLKAAGVNFKRVYEADEEARPSVAYFPTCFISEADGTVVRKLVGFRDKSQLLSWIKGEQEIVDALDEVNEARRRIGLRPFIRDHLLTIAAHNAATNRARLRLFGHNNGQMGDFAFLPQGANATAAGCAAYPPSMGWLSCCWQDNYTYAGASYAMGSDGKRYMHLFVR
jgi:hypothetical protein